MSDKKQNQPRQEEEAVQFGDELPVLPIRNAVLFPGAVAPFDVGREKSVALVEDVDNLSSPVIARPRAVLTTTRTVNAYGCVLGRPDSVCGWPPFSLPLNDSGLPGGNSDFR